MILFEPGVAYPRDSVGEYVELSGPVVRVEEQLGDEWPVDVMTCHGVVQGFSRTRPPLLSQATVRIYAGGGGYYPDSRVVRASAFTRGA